MNSGEAGDTWWSIGQYEAEGIVNKKCVLVVTDQMSDQLVAEQYCQRKNGHLVSLHHISELHELQNVLRYTKNRYIRYFSLPPDRLRGLRFYARQKS
mgnify:CR=1 FL=1